jgi:tetratricopeptide (TPR) repeat protein
MLKLKVLFFIFLVAQCFSVNAQHEQDYFEKGLILEKQFKTEEALAKYEYAIAENPNHAEALTHASRMLSNIGGRISKQHTEQKRSHFEKARAYATRAIELNPHSADARLAHIVSLGLLSEISRSPREKVSDAKLIYAEAKAIIDINPEYPEAYFVLGKWQLELSRLNWFELFATRLFFGGLPEEVSRQAALEYFNKASSLNPHSILFLFGQASAYYELNEKAKAAQLLQKAMGLPLSEPDDAQRKDRCKELLSKIQKGDT